MKRNRGFTLIEILVSLAVLIVGIVGILVLFPAGLNSTQIAIEDTYAATIAESLYNSLRAAAQRMAPGETLIFAHDGIDKATNQFTLPDRPGGLNAGTAIGIPGPINPVEISDGGTEYLGQITNLANLTPVEANFATLVDEGSADLRTNLGGDPGRLNKYKYNIQITYPRDTSPRLTPTGLFDVTIRVFRGSKLVKAFHTKMFIPTDNP